MKALLIFAIIVLLQFVVGVVNSTMDGVANLGFPLYFKSFGGFPYSSESNYLFLLVNILLWLLCGYLYSYFKLRNSGKAI